MKGSDHGIMEAAAQAKRALDQKKAAAGGAPKSPRQASPVDRAVTAGIWVAAVGSLAALIMAN